MCQDEKVNNYGAYYRNESRVSVQRREYRSGNLNLDIRETSSESSEDGTERPLPRYRSYMFYTSLSAHSCLETKFSLFKSTFFPQTSNREYFFKYKR